MNSVEGKKNIMAALLAYQKGEAGFEADKKGNRSNYASIGAVINTAKLANKYGITFTQPTAVHFESGKTHMIQRTILMHADSGETLEGEYPIIVDDMTNSQKIGGAVTYAKRYLLAAMLGTEKGVEDSDDDGAVNGDYQDPPKPEKPEVVSSLPRGESAPQSPQRGGAGANSKVAKKVSDMNFEEMIVLINDKYKKVSADSQQKLLTAALAKATQHHELVALTNTIGSADISIINQIAQRKEAIDGTAKAS